MIDSNEKHLVTGGAGFLGSHLIDYLMTSGKNVTCLDNFYTGTKKNIAKWINHERFQLINGDVENQFSFEVNKIWHMACPASPVHYQKDPIKTAKTSFLGTYNSLELANKFNSKILYTSSSEVYGDPQIHPQVEEYNGSVNPNGIRSCYDEGKRIGETLCFDYKRLHNTEIRVARIFNTYGPRMMPNDGRVVSNFIVQALKGENLTIYGDGSQTRSFCYVDDLIQGLLSLMNNEIEGPINIGNDSEFTILDLAEKILNKVKTTSKIIFKPLPQDDPTKRKPSLLKAYKELNWKPKIDLEEGLDRTINYFSNL